MPTLLSCSLRIVIGSNFCVLYGKIFDWTRNSKQVSIYDYRSFPSHFEIVGDERDPFVGHKDYSLHLFPPLIASGQLGMRNTCFRPIDKSDFNPLVVPTEVDRMHRNRLLWGEGKLPLEYCYYAQGLTLCNF